MIRDKGLSIQVRICIVDIVTDEREIGGRDQCTIASELFKVVSNA